MVLIFELVQTWLIIGRETVKYVSSQVHISLCRKWLQWSYTNLLHLRMCPIYSLSLSLFLFTIKLLPRIFPGPFMLHFWIHNAHSLTCSTPATFLHIWAVLNYISKWVTSITTWPDVIIFCPLGEFCPADSLLGLSNPIGDIVSCCTGVALFSARLSLFTETLAWVPLLQRSYTTI